MDDALRNRLIQLARRRVGDLAEDVVHDAWLAVATRYGVAATQHWNLMARVVVRRAVDVARAEQRRRHLPLEPWHGGVGDVERDALLQIALAEAIALASKRPTLLAYAVGYRDHEIAGAVGISRAGVKSQLHRDRAFVRALRREEVA